jgi:hypothetical protein
MSKDKDASPDKQLRLYSSKGSTSYTNMQATLQRVAPMLDTKDEDIYDENGTKIGTKFGTSKPYYKNFNPDMLQTTHRTKVVGMSSQSVRSYPSHVDVRTGFNSFDRYSINLSNYDKRIADLANKYMQNEDLYGDKDNNFTSETINRIASNIVDEMYNMDEIKVRKVNEGTSATYQDWTYGSEESLSNVDRKYHDKIKQDAITDVSNYISGGLNPIAQEMFTDRRRRMSAKSSGLKSPIIDKPIPGRKYSSSPLTKDFTENKQLTEIFNDVRGITPYYDITYTDPKTGKDVTMKLNEFLTTQNLDKTNNVYDPGDYLSAYDVVFTSGKKEVQAIVKLDPYTTNPDKINEILTQLNTIHKDYGALHQSTKMHSIINNADGAVYQLLEFYGRQGNMTKFHAKPKAQYQMDADWGDWKQGDEHNPDSPYYWQNNQDKYDYYGDAFDSRFNETILKQMGVRDAKIMNILKNSTMQIHDNGLFDLILPDGTSLFDGGIIPEKYAETFNKMFVKDVNTGTKVATTLTEDEIGQFSQYGQDMLAFANLPMYLSQYSNNDNAAKITSLDQGQIMAAAWGLKVDGRLWNTDNFFKSVYTDVVTDMNQIQDKDVLLFRDKQGNKKIVSCAAQGENKQVIDMGNGTTTPQIDSMNEYITTMLNDGYQLFRYRPQTTFPGEKNFYSNLQSLIR